MTAVDHCLGLYGGVYASASLEFLLNTRRAKFEWDSRLHKMSITFYLAVQGCAMSVPLISEVQGYHYLYCQSHYRVGRLIQHQKRPIRVGSSR